MEEDESVSMARWTRIMNKDNGYGGEFNHETSDDKEIVELATAETWCEEMARQFSVELANLRANKDDPPDCFVDFDGKTLGVELVQMINPDHKRRANKGESPHANPLFQDTQWDASRIRQEVDLLVDQKAEKYAKRGVSIDVLLIHTAEPWLYAAQIEEFLANNTFAPRSGIANVFLLMRYDPSRKQWPLFKLYGDL